MTKTFSICKWEKFCHFKLENFLYDRKNPKFHLRTYSKFFVAIMDLIFLSMTVIREGICYGILDALPMWYIMICPYVFMPFYNISRLSTIYMVVVVSIERLYALYFPLVRNLRCSSYILCVILFSGNQLVK